MSYAKDETQCLRGIKAASDVHPNSHSDRPNRSTGSQNGGEQVGDRRANDASRGAGAVRARRDTIAGGILRGLIASAKQQRNLIDDQIANLEGLLATLEERVSDNPGD